MRKARLAAVVAILTACAVSVGAQTQNSCGANALCWLKTGEDDIFWRHYVEAREDLSIAAKLGSRNAEYGLALLYRNQGTGFVDRSTSAYWLIKAARDGVTPAQILLASEYINGSPPIPKDRIEAYRWFSIAAATATEESQRADAQRGREVLAKALTPEQIARGQARALDVSK